MAIRGQHAKTATRSSKRGRHAAEKTNLLASPLPSFALSSFRNETASKKASHAASREAAANLQSARMEGGAEKASANTATGFSGAAQKALVALALVALALALWLGYRIFITLEQQVLGDSPRSAFPTLTDSGVEAPVVSFGQYFDITSDADKQASDVSPHQIVLAAPAPAQHYVDNVQAKYQMSVLEGGCEVVALEIALDAMGLDADSNHIADNLLTIDGHFATGYSGDPYGAGGGYPPGIVNAANGYLAEVHSPLHAYDITGATFEDLKSLVQKGYPVLVWSTMGFGEPVFSGVYDNGVEWYENEHCVVLYGFEGGQVKVSDPLGGLVTHDASNFQRIYEACGSMAAVVY